jgi:polyisoprenoid-binding protein YceI
MSPRILEDHAAGIDMPVGTYYIDPARSTVSFTTRHLFGLGRVQGTFDLHASEIRVAHPVEKSSVRAVLAADSFTTGNTRRDDDVRSAKFLDAAAHPHITFTSDRLQQVNGTWAVSGTLCAHGISRPIELMVDQVRCSGTDLSLRAQARIDRYDFGITAARSLAARHLDLQVQVVAHAQNPKES